MSIRFIEIFLSRYVNRTTLRTCTGGIRPEKRIIGGGSSGVHMGWLLNDGFENTILYEQKD